MSNGFWIAILIFCALSASVLPENIPEQNVKINIRNRRQSEDEHCPIPQIIGGTLKVNNGENFVALESGFTAEEGTVLGLKCNKKFIISGPKIIRCINGHWSATPTCLKSCKALINPSFAFTCTLNGGTIPCHQRSPVGTVANIRCSKGYKSSQSHVQSYSITCETNGKWSFSYLKCNTDCGTVVGSGSKFVIGGKDATIPEFPWHAAIYLKQMGSEPHPICGGSIISPNAILSAAHCFWDKTKREARIPDFYAVGYGKVYSKWNSTGDLYGKYSDVKELIVHDDYDDAQGNYAQDIAVLFLKNIIEFSDIIKPVCVDWSSSRSIIEIDPYATGKVAGWGWTQETGIPSNKLLQISIPTVRKDICWDKVPSDVRPHITGDKFCAGSEDGSSVCHGDSGGGLCFSNTDAEGNVMFYIRGIVSLAPSRRDIDACDSWSFTAFTDTSDHTKWLKSLDCDKLPNVFKCANGILVTGTACNQIQDCEDGSDESEELCID